MSITSAVAAREACRHDDGRFGEQRRDDPGDRALGSQPVTSVIGLLRREILPTLPVADDRFDLEALGMWLRERDLIRSDADGRVSLPSDLSADPAFQAKVAELVETAEQVSSDMWVEDCVVCGQPSDYCPGHGEIGDPAGYRILVAHDEGDHSMCVADCHTEPDE